MIMENKAKLVLSITLITLLGVFFFLLFPKFESDAGSLDAYFYMSRMDANLAGTSGPPDQTVEYILAFTPDSSFSSAGSVTITFPVADNGQWCRTAGSLTVAGVGSSTSAADQPGSTDWTINTALPGTLSASCTQGSSPSVDTITITGLTALTAGTTYGVRLSNGSSAGVLGTSSTTGHRTITVEVKQGSTIDATTFNVYIISGDQVVVSATVSGAPSVTCSISHSTRDLGTLYPGGSFVTSTAHTIGTSTSNAGYYWVAYGLGNGTTAGLRRTTSPHDLLESNASGTVVLTAGNSEGFGMTVSDPDGVGSAVVPSDFQTGTLGQFGGLGSGPSGARLILYQPDEQGSSETANIVYGARASTSATSGTYQETVTFVCGGYY